MAASFFTYNVSDGRLMVVEADSGCYRYHFQDQLSILNCQYSKDIEGSYV